MKFLLLLVISLAAISTVSSLSCVCGVSPCEEPGCCASGILTKDACACCNDCAKDDGQRCGGPWNIGGMCKDGFSCLRQCECRSEESDKKCVFPFIYKGKRYDFCTKADTTNGKAWCALEVDSDNVVIPGKWEDCREQCEMGCNQASLFNFHGRCVPNEVRKKIEDSNVRRIFQFDDSATSVKSVTQCPSSNPDFTPKCHCDQDIPKGTEGHCKKLPRFEDTDIGNGYCFLKHVSNHKKPAENCFEDAEWSPTHGKFYSNDACNES